MRRSPRLQTKERVDYQLNRAYGSNSKLDDPRRRSPPHDDIKADAVRSGVESDRAAHPRDGLENDPLRSGVDSDGAEEEEFGTPNSVGTELVRANQRDVDPALAANPLSKDDEKDEKDDVEDDEVSEDRTNPFLRPEMNAILETQNRTDPFLAKDCFPELNQQNTPRDVRRARQRDTRKIKNHEVYEQQQWDLEAKHGLRDINPPDTGPRGGRRSEPPPGYPRPVTPRRNVTRSALGKGTRADQVHERWVLQNRFNDYVRNSREQLRPDHVQQAEANPHGLEDDDAKMEYLDTTPQRPTRAQVNHTQDVRQINFDQLVALEVLRRDENEREKAEMERKQQMLIQLQRGGKAQVIIQDHEQQHSRGPNQEDARGDEAVEDVMAAQANFGEAHSRAVGRKIDELTRGWGPRAGWTDLQHGILRSLLSWLNDSKRAGQSNSNRPSKTGRTSGAPVPRRNGGGSPGGGPPGNSGSPPAGPGRGNGPPAGRGQGGGGPPGGPGRGQGGGGPPGGPGQSGGGPPGQGPPNGNDSSNGSSHENSDLRRIMGPRPERLPDLDELRRSVRRLTNQLEHQNQPRISGLTNDEIRALLAMTIATDGVYAGLGGVDRPADATSDLEYYDRKQADRRLTTMAKTFPFDTNSDIVEWFDELEFFAVQNGVRFDGLFRKIVTEMIDTTHRNDLRYYNQTHPRTAIRSYEAFRSWLIKKRMNPDALRTAWRSVESWKQKETKLPTAYERFMQRVAQYVKQVRFAQMAGKTDEEINKPTESTVFLVFLNGLRVGNERKQLHGLWAELRISTRLLAHLGKLCDVIEARLRPGCGIEPFGDSRTGRVAICEEQMMAFDAITCTHCKRKGHEIDNCYQLHPEKKPKSFGRGRRPMPWQRRARAPIPDEECCSHCLKSPTFPRRIKHEAAVCWTLHPKLREEWRAKWKKLRKRTKTPEQRKELMAMMYADQVEHYQQFLAQAEDVQSEAELESDSRFYSTWDEAMTGKYTTIPESVQLGRPQEIAVLASNENNQETKPDVQMEAEQMEDDEDDSDDDPDTERYYVHCL